MVWAPASALSWVFYFELGCLDSLGGRLLCLGFVFVICEFWILVYVVVLQCVLGGLGC